MRKTFIGIIIFTGLAFSIDAGISIYEYKEATPDPKREKAGEDCKKSDQCQSHHTCGEAKGKNVCIAPTPWEIPNT